MNNRLPFDLPYLAAETDAAPSDVKLKLGLFADSHYADVDAIGSRRPRLSLDKVKRAVEYFKENGVNMIISLGDLINAACDTEKDEKALLEITEPLRESGILTYCVWGNHDTEAMETERLFEVSGIFSAPAAVSAFGSNLILLDLCHKRDGTKYTAHENDWTNTALPDDQLKWLEKQLRFTDGDVYVFTHQNLAGDEGDPHVAANAAEVRKVLEKYDNVRAVYSGHRHHGGYSKINGIEYITLKAMCEEENDTLDSFCRIINFE